MIESPTLPKELESNNFESRPNSKNVMLESKLTKTIDPMKQSVERISTLNVQTKMIALNARIEAVRCGGASGRTFDVVARSISDISEQTSNVAANLVREFQDLQGKVREITNDLVSRSRGERLSDLALANIDLIDRNLYERSCDVRWWATDSSVVDALMNPTDDAIEHASRRLGQILDAYTVYFDIVIADLNGRVLANGRPNEFAAKGSLHSSENWFIKTTRTTSGTDFIQSDVGQNSLCPNDRTIIYACTIRKGGTAEGSILGVLAVVFRWDALAQTVLERTPLSESEWQKSRACIVDSHGTLLADTSRQYGTNLKLQGWNDLLASPHGYRSIAINGSPHCIGHAASPGYETYRTGWYSLLIQRETAM